MGNHRSIAGRVLLSAWAFWALPAQAQEQLIADGPSMMRQADGLNQDPAYKKARLAQLEQGIITIDGEISPETVKKIRAELNYIQSNLKDLKSITVYINSPGGHVDSGLAIADMLRTFPKEVKTVGQGSVVSIAFDIFMAGDKRETYAGTIFMQHPITAEKSDKEGAPAEQGMSDAESDAIIKEQTAYAARAVAEKSKLNVKQLAEMFASNCVFGAEFALQQGFATGLIEGKDAPRAHASGTAKPISCPGWEKAQKLAK